MTTTGGLDCRQGGSLDARVAAWYVYSGVSAQGRRMKLNSFLMVALLCGQLVLLAASACRATVVTFDDLPSTANGLLITNGYQSLSWSNFGYVNAILHSNLNGVSGYNYGMVTASNVALNASGFPAEIDARGTNLNFLSAYLTGAWNSNLSIQVQGFNGATLLYNTTVVASATSPTLFTFDYTNINELAFNSFGGQDAGFGSGAGENFVMDNFDFEFVPEPSAFLLTAAGALMLWSVAKRKRR